MTLESTVTSAAVEREMDRRIGCAVGDTLTAPVTPPVLSLVTLAQAEREYAEEIR